MREIRVLCEQELKGFVKIARNAYPGIRITTQEEQSRLEERLIKSQKENPIAKIYGLFESGKLLGGMRFFDFDMTLHTQKIKAGGVGFVAVDLLHKKEKVARDMIKHFIKHYRDEGVNMCMLYPFRPDFYKKMGFGFGTKMNQYRIKPECLPGKSGKAHLVFLSEKDKGQLLDCFNRFTSKNNGMIYKYPHEVDLIFNAPENRVMGYKSGEKLLGYMVFEFKAVKEGVPQFNDIHVKEFVYENRDVFLEFMAFLNSQGDQINGVVINTQDESFHHLLQDPRNGTGNVIPFVYHESNTQGVGIMYRIVNVDGLFRELGHHNFHGSNIKLRLRVKDDFLQENNKSLVLHFINGRVIVADKEDFEVEIELNISELSSMVTGAVDFRALYNYGLAHISDEKQIDSINAIFRTTDKPICMTSF
jgi:predicted acetyltransferase